MIQDNGEGARRRGDTPGEITIERRRARHMPAAVEIEHEAAAVGRGSNDGDCFDPVDVNVCRLRILRRDLALDEPAQSQAHALGAYAHRGPAPLRWIPATSSLPRLLPQIEAPTLRRRKR